VKRVDSSEAEDTDADALQEGEDVDVSDGAVSSDDDKLTGQGPARVGAILAAEVRAPHFIASEERNYFNPASYIRGRPS